MSIEVYYVLDGLRSWCLYTVTRKTIQGGPVIIYSHIVFDKKYKIDPETKRNVFRKWKVRLVFDGNKQKSHEDVFWPTPSLPMIRTLPKYYNKKINLFERGVTKRGTRGGEHFFGGKNIMTRTVRVMNSCHSGSLKKMFVNISWKREAISYVKTSREQ